MFILLKIECPIIDKNRSAFLPVKLYIYRTHPCKPQCHFCGLAPLGRKSDIEVYMMENIPNHKKLNSDIYYFTFTRT